MINLRRQDLRALVVIVLTAVIMAVATHVCFAACVEPALDESQTLTGHIVADTAARGIDFVFKPLHRGLSGAFFWALRPCEPKLTTTVHLKNSPPNK